MPDFFSSPIIAAFCGTFVGAFLTSWLTKRKDRVKLTMDFHKEWNSYEMSTQRRAAYHCIKKFPDSNYNDLTILDEKGSIAVYIVLRFYQRLWQCFDTNNLDKQLTANLFYDNFYWYYYISFNTSLKPVKEDWSAYYEIDKLKTKFREYISVEVNNACEENYNKKYKDYVAAKELKGNEINIESKTLTINGSGNFQITHG